LAISPPGPNLADPGDVGPRNRSYGGAMEPKASTRRLMSGLAARAGIEQTQRRRNGQMTANELTDEHPTNAGALDPKAAARAMWALGDYHRFATETVWELGPVLVEACGISVGERVLDIAAGSGNVAIAAVKAGASVVASDLTPENFEAGRRQADEEGVELEWVEGDAEALPFGDDEFDAVTSSLGAIFAPDHQAVADEMVRVCRPGGTIGMINFTPEGLAADFFGLLAPYAPPPPPEAQPPLMWGSEEHVRELFGDRLGALELTRREYVETAASPSAYRELFKETFGPVVATYAGLADQPDRVAALDREFLEFATRANKGDPEGPAAYRYEYLLVVGHLKAAD
jgi:ubiquinone/menaquinone biosynthesis C-methylase UbiE